MSSRRGAAGYGAAVRVLVLVGLVGCGGGVKTYPVNGKVVLEDGDVQQLAGSHVELMLESDPLVRASGRIRSDGTFGVETLHEGRILKGAREGTYQARIIPADEDDEGRPRRGPLPIHKRFLDFKTAGLSVKVPTEGEVILKVSRR
ncbi:MAG TPA: hypothetical protein VNK04_12460 [Gemmataceae bacterium]|nr:hypothetical protein [Gemmataceae bacterium]